MTHDPRAYQRTWYLQHRAQILDKLRRQYQEQRDERLARAKATQAQPHYRAQEQARRSRPVARVKQRARSAAYRALQRGALVRQPCEVCGSPETQMHHDDYAQPLVVRWRCRAHHFHLHRLEEIP